MNDGNAWKGFERWRAGGFALGDEPRLDTMHAYPIWLAISVELRIRISCTHSGDGMGWDGEGEGTGDDFISLSFLSAIWYMPIPFSVVRKVAMIRLHFALFQKSCHRTQNDQTQSIYITFTKPIGTSSKFPEKIREALCDGKSDPNYFIPPELSTFDCAQVFTMVLAGGCVHWFPFVWSTFFYK